MNTAAESKVMIVDDEQYVLETASQILADKNYSVLVCRDAGEALNKMKDESVDIVLTDIKMPGHFDQNVMNAFNEISPRFDEIYNSFSI